MKIPAALARPEQLVAIPEFAELAGLLGHDLARLRNGEEICSDTRIGSLGEARRILTRADARARRLRAETFFDAIADRREIGQGLHDRGEAAVFAEGEIPAADAHGHGRHFPLHVRARSVAVKRLEPGETLDASVAGEVWGLEPLEELYSILNVGLLVLSPGSRLIVRGNVFSLLCQQLVVEGPPTARPPDEPAAHIAILPTPMPVDFRTGPVQGVNGGHGDPGGNGAPGFVPAAAQGMMGPLLPAGVEPARMHGEDGSDGSDGKPGGRGRNGGMAKLAELTIRSLDVDPAPLVVVAKGGTGGNGGDGGDGGNGGYGGAGAKGGRSLAGPLPGGDGGGGGDGGDAGDGGHPGNGGLASNVYLTVPPGATGRVLLQSIAGTPGRLGRPGRPGVGGSGGPGGASPEGAGAAGAAGRDGALGRPGRTGRRRTPPAMFLNDLRTQ